MCVCVWRAEAGDKTAILLNSRRYPPTSQDRVKARRGQSGVRLQIAGREVLLQLARGRDRAVGEVSDLVT